MSRLSLAVALGVGVGGALVDVSSYARLTDGLERSWGRTDGFYEVEPGTFSFVLDNADGRFTPENPNSPLATTLTEGMTACIQLGTRLTLGTVRSIEPEFPSGESAWAKVRVGCDDLLASMSRQKLLTPTQIATVSPGGVWSFSDPAGSPFFLDTVSGLGNPIGVGSVVGVEYQVPATAPGGDVQATLSIGAAQTATLETRAEALYGFATENYGVSYAAGVWFTPRNLTSFLQIGVNLGEGAFNNALVQFGIDDDRFFVVDTSGPTTYYSDPFEVGTAYHLSVDMGDDIDNTITFRVNGSPVVSFPGFLVAYLFYKVTITVGAVVAGDTEVSLSDLTLTTERVQAENIIGGTVPTRLGFYANIGSPDWATIPSNLYPAPLTAAQTRGKSLLDVVNELVAVEQGYLYTQTSGTLTSPVGVVSVRARERPEAVDYSFHVEDELQGAPGFVRDITNLVSSVRVESDAGTTVVIDATLVSRSVSASLSESLPLAINGDRLAWGQDRILRGANTQLRVASVVVDAMTTPTDRSADLLALTPGDRVRFTGLPETVLGFDTWDGWFIGARETHNVIEHAFELYFAPVLPDTAIFDTDRFMADGELTLSGNINSSVTSITIASTGALLSTTEEPYSIILDSEEMTVTAVTGATSPQTVTVTRGVNGTTAASHTSGAIVVSTPDSLYAF